MSDEAKKMKEHKKFWDALQLIKQTISKLETNQIEIPEATEAGIQQGSLSLEEESDYPVFFTQFTEKLDTAADAECPTYDPEEERHNTLNCIVSFIRNGMPNPHFDENMDVDDYPKTGIAYRAWGEFNFGELWELHQWVVEVTCTTPKDTHLPHMKWLMSSEVEGSDDQLTRGEIFSIVQIMAGRLKTKSLRPHVIAPAMVFSVMAPFHIRVLEAYYDGKELVVRKTKLYDLRENTEKTMEVLARWWWGFATGETTTIAKIPVS